MDEIIWPLEKTVYGVKFEAPLRQIINQSKRISFSGLCKSCCVGIVDAVDSTKITATLSNKKMCEYYRIFLNWMAVIAQEFDAVIVKNIGDSLLYYFPKTEDDVNQDAIRKTLECSMTMIESHHMINRFMLKLGLPPIDYRVSADYGELTIAESYNSVDNDIFGTTVNVCAKINTLALPNHVVIGGDLYRISRSLKEYIFDERCGYSLGLKLDYPVYSLYRSKKVR